MNETETKLARKRLKAAYKANGIPWKEECGKIPVPQMNFLSDCWEKRARGEEFAEALNPVDQSVQSELIETMHRLRRRYGPSPSPRHGAQAQWASEAQYHGDRLGARI